MAAEDRSILLESSALSDLLDTPGKNDHYVKDGFVVSDDDELIEEDLADEVCLSNIIEGKRKRRPPTVYEPVEVPEDDDYEEEGDSGYEDDEGDDDEGDEIGSSDSDFIMELEDEEEWSEEKDLEGEQNAKDGEAEEAEEAEEAGGGVQDVEGKAEEAGGAVQDVE